MTTEGNQDSRRRTRAVSPVIGIILMVAITVILGAVIASFVLGIGVGTQSPQASLTAADADDTEGPGGGSTLFKITHQGGATLDVANLNVSIEKANGNEVLLGYDGSELSDGVPTTGGGSTWPKLQINNQNVSSGGSLTVGDTMTILEKPSIDTGSISSGEEYRVVITHGPSDSVLVDAVVVVK